MMRRVRTFLGRTLLIAALAVLFSFDLPAGWIKAGSEPGSYDMGTDPGAGLNGNNAATIKSVKKKIKGFGTLMQLSPADTYAGKRVRMSGYVRSNDIAGWGGLWMRVDQKGVKGSLAFDNMQGRPIKGTTDWTKHDIVLDVPKSATGIAYGALLSGTGQIWFDDLIFEIVDSTVAITGRGPAQPRTPTNLDFEK